MEDVTEQKVFPEQIDGMEPVFSEHLWFVTIHSKSEDSDCFFGILKF